MKHKKMQELQNKIMGQRSGIVLTKGITHDIRKRQFIKKGFMGIIAGIGIAVFSKMTGALQNVQWADNTDPVGSSKGVAKAWLNINGTGTATLQNSYNVSGITDAGTGNYEVTLTTPFSTANDNVIVTGGHDGVVADERFVVGITGVNLAAGVFRLIGSREDGTSGVSTHADGTDIMAAAFGDQ